MSILPSSLLLLLGLRLRAGWRRLLRGLKTPKGIVGFLLLLGFFGLWLVSALVASGAPPGPGAGLGESMGGMAPLLLVALLAVSVLTSSGDKALAFLQAEVDLLFPAPFTRRQLLLYKLAQRVVPLAFVSLFLSIWMLHAARHWIAAVVGIYLVLWFLNLGTLAAALAGQLLGEHRFRLWRRAGLAVLAGGLLLASARLGDFTPRGLLEGVRAFSMSTAGRVIAAPAVPFTRTFGADDLLRELPLWAGVAMAINLVLLLACIWLDANWLEASVESSRRLQERLERFRATGGLSARPAGLAFLRLPMPPRLRGAGPLMWRQATAALRGTGRTVAVMLAFGAAVVLLPRLLRRDGGASVGPAIRPLAGIMLGYFSLILPQLLRADFRGDVDRMDVLKGLPLHPGAVAAAQIAVPAVIVTLLQCAVGGALVVQLEWGPAVLALLALGLLAANFIVVGIDNAAFLIWPHRFQAAPGMGIATGQFLIQVGKMLAIALLLGAAAGAGALAGALAGWRLEAIAAASGAILLVETILLLSLVALLFARFDAAAERVPDA